MNMLQNLANHSCLQNDPQELGAYFSAPNIFTQKPQTQSLVWQKTLARPFYCEGIGLHSAKPVSLKVFPAAPNSGIVFQRLDLDKKDTLIPCHTQAVQKSSLCTTLSNPSGVRVSTIEHLMSALRAYDIDNARVELCAQELPILDGSAAPYVALLEHAGFVEQKEPRKVIKIIKEISASYKDAQTTLRPANAFEISFDIDFSNKVIGQQSYKRRVLDRQEYRMNISQARTFGFYENIKMMRLLGLGRGGSLENAILVDKDRVVNKEGLRYPDEFVRHKVLDAIGDLFVCGYPIIGHFHGHKAGHKVNNLLLRALEENKDHWRLEPQAQAQASILKNA